jgi:hypothetical protein
MAVPDAVRASAESWTESPGSTTLPDPPETTTVATMAGGGGGGADGSDPPQDTMNARDAASAA